MGEDFVTGVQFDSEHDARELLDDLAFDLDALFFGIGFDLSRPFASCHSLLDYRSKDFGSRFGHHDHVLEVSGPLPIFSHDRPMIFEAMHVILALIDHRLYANRHAFLELGAGSLAPKVGDARIFVKAPADPVAD